MLHLMNRETDGNGIGYSDGNGYGNGYGYGNGNGYGYGYGNGNGNGYGYGNGNGNRPPLNLTPVDLLTRLAAGGAVCCT